MIVLKILFGLIVIWLGGSLIYSIRFHVRNYLVLKEKMNSGEIDNSFNVAANQINWKSIYLIQFLKLLLITVLVIFIATSFEMNSGYNGRQIENKWTEQAKLDFLNACMSDKPIKSLSLTEIEEYCKCVLEKTMLEYPDPDEMGDYLPDEFVLKAGMECLDEVRKK